MTINQTIQTPVFVDNLPAVTNIHSRHSAPYRLKRELQLISLLMDSSVVWHDTECPACGAAGLPKHFSLGRLPFNRCQSCNTIYAAKVPDQAVLDRLRLDLVDVTDLVEERPQRSVEFISILNWIRLSSARYGRPLTSLVDYRFDSHAPGFASAVVALGNSERDWTHVPLAVAPESDPYADIAAALKAKAPEAVLVQADMDRCRSPRMLLQKLKHNLAPGTLVFISTSCADGLEYEILGAESPSFVSLDRLNLFSVKGFRKLADEIGFRSLEVSTPGRLDAVILKSYFDDPTSTDMPFWSSFFKEANRDRLQDLQVLLQRSLRSGVMRLVLEA